MRSTKEEKQCQLNVFKFMVFMEEKKIDESSHDGSMVSYHIQLRSH